MRFLITGLCGAIHSGICRHIRAELAADPNIKVICVGDKSRAILQRLYSKNILMVAGEVSCYQKKLVC
jgi:F-type H+-transporting ATPase subunit gamma